MSALGDHSVDRVGESVGDEVHVSNATADRHHCIGEFGPEPLSVVHWSELVVDAVREPHRYRHLGEVELPRRLQRSGVVGGIRRTV